MEFLKTLVFLKLKPRHIFAACLATALLLFTPQAFIKEIGLANFEKTWRSWIGAGFLLSASLLVAHLGAWVWRPIHEFIKLQLDLHRGGKMTKSSYAK
ncbi:MAG: superinfection exclusion B family protein [Nitrospirales bacterium]|nr:superinfection exclusion B family protein [Nitrospirales bacterium]